MKILVHRNNTNGFFLTLIWDYQLITKSTSWGIFPIVVLNAVDFVEVIHSELYSIKILVTDFTLETVWMETLSSGSQNSLSYFLITNPASLQ